MPGFKICFIPATRCPPLRAHFEPSYVMNDAAHNLRRPHRSEQDRDPTEGRQNALSIGVIRCAGKVLAVASPAVGLPNRSSALLHRFRTILE